jgi:hypothetical protein
MTDYFTVRKNAFISLDATTKYKVINPLEHSNNYVLI